MAWGDARTRRIPNYLTLGAALAGLGFQLGAHGWPGLGQGLLGFCVGFVLLIGFYLKGGMGAGDVKALAALGTWLGPLPTLYLFIYMGFSGVPLIILFLWRRGELRTKAREWWTLLVNRLLLRSQPSSPSPAPAPAKRPRVCLTPWPWPWGWRSCAGRGCDAPGQALNISREL